MQQFGNTIMLMMFMKFMFNDVAHAIGLLDTVETAPYPEFVTHSSSAWEKILMDGALKPIGVEEELETTQYVPLSFDGMWSKYSDGERVFKFSLDRVLSYKPKPVFYLGTMGFIREEIVSGYDIMDVTAMWAAEIKVYGEVRVSEADLTEHLPKTPLQRYMEPAFPYMRKVARAVIMKTQTPPFIPPDDVAKIVHGYNRMVCNMFGVDYRNVLDAAMRAGVDEWVKWW